MGKLSHIDEHNRPTMVDVGDKTATERTAHAQTLVELPPEVLAELDSGEIATYCRYHKQQVRELIQHYLKSDNAALLDAICIMKEGAITTAYMTKEYDNITKKCVTILHKL